MTPAPRNPVAAASKSRASPTNRIVFTLAELYDDYAALEAHRLTPHFLLFKKRAEEGNLIVSKTSALGEVISG